MRRSFRDDETGASAVEFAMIAAPFFFMLFAVVEIALAFFSTVALEHAVTETAREIRTGVFQQSGGDAEAFRQNVCTRARGVIDCDRLSMDVRVWDSFRDINPSNPLTDDGDLDDDEFRFDPGAELDIVMVRIFYRWKVITPLLGAGFSNMADGQRLITATAAFRNEPFNAPSGAQP